MGKVEHYKLVYAKYYGMIHYLVVQNYGKPEDATEVFRTTILILLEKSKAPGFKFTANLKTYIYSISRAIWFGKIRQENKNTKVKDFEDYLDAEVNVLSSDNPEAQSNKIAQVCLNKLDDTSKMLLIYFYYFKQSPSDISKLLNFSDVQAVKQHKNNSLQTLSNIVN